MFRRQGLFVGITCSILLCIATSFAVDTEGLFSEKTAALFITKHYASLFLDCKFLHTLYGAGYCTSAYAGLHTKHKTQNSKPAVPMHQIR